MISKIRDSLLDLQSLVNTSPQALAFRADSISRWSVGQHVDHLLKVDRSVLTSIVSGQTFPKNKPKTLVGNVVLITGFIPRGKAESPAALAGEEVAITDIGGRVTELLGLLDKIPKERLKSKEPFMEHPFLGTFSVRDWLRFLEVHHRHHEKIINALFRSPERSVTRG